MEKGDYHLVPSLCKEDVEISGYIRFLNMVTRAIYMSHVARVAHTVAVPLRVD